MLTEREWRVLAWIAARKPSLEHDVEFIKAHKVELGSTLELKLWEWRFIGKDRGYFRQLTDAGWDALNHRPQTEGSE